MAIGVYYSIDIAILDMERTMTCKARTATVIGIVLCMIPIIVLGQTFDLMPPSTVNDRFRVDAFQYSNTSLGYYPVKHPSLTLNGFDNGENNSHGYGLKQILQIAYQGTNPMVDKKFNQIVDNSLKQIVNPASPPPNESALIAVNNNSNIAQCRAFVALERYVCYKNGITQQIPNATTNAPDYSIAIDSLKSALTMPSSYFLANSSIAGDQVKWTRSLENMARALDLYLALENAFQHYIEPDYTDSVTGGVV